MLNLRICSVIFVWSNKEFRNISSSAFSWGFLKPWTMAFLRTFKARVAFSKDSARPPSPCCEAWKEIFWSKEGKWIHDKFRYITQHRLHNASPLHHKQVFLQSFQKTFISNSVKIYSAINSVAKNLNLTISKLSIADILYASFPTFWFCNGVGVGCT